MVSVMDKILVIIPAYNEESAVEHVVQEVQKHCPSADYLIVDDASTDNTYKICRDNRYNYIRLPINLGIGGAVQAGYTYAVENNYDVTVQLDGDGQHDPSQVPMLVEPVLKGEADMVIGSRFISKKGFQSSAMRRLGIKIMRSIIKVTSGASVADATSGFRACSKELTRFFSENYAHDYPEPEAILTAALNGFNVKEVPVVMRDRKGGASSINMPGALYYMVKVSVSLLICRIKYLNLRTGDM